MNIQFNRRRKPSLRAIHRAQNQMSEPRSMDDDAGDEHHVRAG